ncbi:hypothetical protein [Winogradskyella forsetii]|uniref:hypothetical protein n=1 Tax=Winogradskyella forsetii TaxID=2686077 RepID=UPI0015C03143|nr:hypothetical protein [Winogradskyella forsetii]
MTSIKTSESATHYCRLQASGATNNRCKEQCTSCERNKVNHSPAIKVLSQRLEKLHEALAEEQKIIDEPELMSAYHFAMANAANIEREILSISQSISKLNTL